MKKLLPIVLCAIIFTTGCTNSNNTESITNSNIESNIQTSDVESSTSQEELILDNYFAVSIKDNVLDKFNLINDEYSFEQYVTNNIMSINIDNNTYTIKQTKFSDVINNLKSYITDEESLQYINNSTSTIANGKFYVCVNITNALSVILRFNTDDVTQTIKDYVLYSFTVDYNVSAAKNGDTLTDNFECVFPLTMTKDIWESKISSNVNFDDTNVNLYYTYHNPDKSTINEVTINGYTIQTAFDRTTGYLMNLTYEVNS